MSTRRQPLLPATEKPAAEEPPFKSKDHPVCAKTTPSPSLYILISLVLFSGFLFLTSTTRQPPPRLLHPPPENSTARTTCPAGILPFYIYPLPAKFNLNLLDHCKALNMYTDMCPFVSHTGLGQPLSRPGWYFTHQFLAEIVFHHRALRHPCRVSDPAAASLFYAPFYAGLYASSVVRLQNLTLRDSLALDFADHLTGHPWWRRNHGADHFFVSGRTAWDFLRTPGHHDYGANRLLNLPAARNMTVLTVERQPWDRSLRQHGIPYPSYFHPFRSNDLSTWQRRVISLSRPHLFSFVGATRKGLEKAAVRGLIIQQCADSTGCKLLDCSGGRVGKCFDPMKVIRVMEGSRFCLQAPGDSFTRRSTFDSFLAGCVPVFFSEHTAYSQYSWYLPAEAEDYSVFIDEKTADVKRIEQVLAAIPASKVRKMRENIVMKILPRVTYMHPDADGDVFDAVDVALKALSDEIRSSAPTTSE